MKFFAALSLAAVAAAVAQASPVERSTDSDVGTLMVRDTPTCWLGNTVCNDKCKLRGKSGGSCLDGVCTCNGSKRDGAKVVMEDAAAEKLAKKKREVEATPEHHMMKRISCQVGGIFGQDNLACTYSCQDAGHKQGYCNDKSVCHCVD